MRPLLAALQFLTAIPVHAQLNEESFERAPVWFPLTGLTIGLMVAFPDAILARIGFAPLVRSALSVGFLAAISGGLHLDGLADTADGFLSRQPRKRALEIMRDSRIGAMGTLALVFVIAVKITALAELDEALRWRALVVAPLAGRSMLLAMLSLLPYAREEGGLATLFLRRRRPALALWAVLWLGAGAIACFGAAGLVLVAVNLLGVVLFAAWCSRRVGGFTGDTLGATSEIAETLVLATLCCL